MTTCKIEVSDPTIGVLSSVEHFTSLQFSLFGSGFKFSFLFSFIGCGVGKRVVGFRQFIQTDPNTRSHNL